MQMKKIVLLNLCLVVTFVLSASQWTRQDIGKLCSFSFPAAPHITDVRDIQDYIYNTDSSSYLVQVRAVAKKGVIGDTATLNAFYKGVQDGVIRGYKASLIGTKPIMAEGLRAQEVEFTKGSENHQAIGTCCRILLLNDHMIVYSFSAPFDRFASQKKNQERFFASFSLPGSELHRQYNDTVVNASEVHIIAPAGSAVPAAPATIHTELVKPNTLHFIISFVVAILLLAGIVYLIVSRRNKKNKS
jgi:hypothetical protein